MMTYRRSLMVGDPGLFGSIGRALSGAARSIGGIVGAAIPGAGLVRGIASVASQVGRRRGGGGGVQVRGPSLTMPGFGMQGPSMSIGGRGRGGGGGFKRGRRMNAGNAKAARRAIRRIKAVHSLLKAIEREMPKVRVRVGGSPGVITRSEAARALRR